MEPALAEDGYWRARGDASSLEQDETEDPISTDRRRAKGDEELRGAEWPCPHLAKYGGDESGKSMASVFTFSTGISDEGRSR